MHGHDCGISDGPAIYVGLVLPSVSELGDTEETSLVNGSNDLDRYQFLTIQFHSAVWSETLIFGNKGND